MSDRIPGHERITGRVLSAQGDTVVIRTDGGHRIAVNIAGVDPEIRNAIRVNDAITVLGRRSEDRMLARAARAGAPDDASPPSAAPATGPGSERGDTGRTGTGNSRRWNAALRDGSIRAPALQIASGSCSGSGGGASLTARRSAMP